MPRSHASGRLLRFLALVGVLVALVLGFTGRPATATGGSINGTVFDDLNNDGLFAAENGHSSVVVFLDINTNGVFDAGDFTTTADGLGAYSFANVADGTYSVKAVVPSGYGATTPNPAITIVSGGSNNLNVNIGISNVGAISGVAFNDVDGDGTQDIGEAASTGKTIFIDTNLNGSYQAGEPVTTTDSGGAYSFTGLAAGSSASVRMSVPGTAIRTTPNPSTIAVTAGLNITGINFGLFTYGSLAGTIFNDVNADGVKAVSDTGIINRTVYCDLNGNGGKDTGEPFATTVAGGAYSIANLGPITCAPRLVIIAGTIQTTTNPSTIVVTSGLATTGADFGSFTNGSITGYVYSDSNNSGVKDTSESGLSGKTLYIDANSNGVLDVGETNVNTSGTGQYTFSNVGPGTYLVRAVLPANATLTSAAGMSVTMTSAQSAAGTNFGFFLDAMITGSVYEDTDGGASLTAGELGLSGQTVYVDANSNDTFDVGEISTSTNSSGIYTFSGLGPATYRIRVDIPVGWMHTTTYPVPTTPTSASSTTLNFGLFELATIGGTVYDDVSGDGLKAVGDPGVSSVTVYMDQNSNNTFDVGEPFGITASNGTWSISGLTPATYKPRVVMPVATTLTTTLPVAVKALSGMVSNVSNFGLFANVIITGSVYGDFDGNGARQLGEAGLAGKLVFLDTNSNGILTTGEPTATTDSSGNYSFPALGPGTYKVRVNVVSGIVQTSANPANVVATSGASVSGVDFGLFGTSSITGTVFNDVNGNGVKDAGEAGLLTRTVYLDINLNGAYDGLSEPSAITGTGGVYTISSLGPGTYQPRVVIPTNNVQTSATLASVTTTAGSVSITNDFGLFTLGSIAGTVYDDKNGNGAKGSSEPVLAGRTVYLDLDSNGVFDTGEPTALTSGTGTYSFTGLVYRSYLVRLQPLSGVTQTTPNPSALTVLSTTAVTSVDFGTYALAIISGTIYDDANGNAALNVPNDVGVSGMTVFMDNNNNGVLDTGEITTTTNSVGLYTFANLGPGNYIVRAVFAPAAILQTTTALGAIAPNSGQTSAGNNIGLFTYGVVSGQLFMDENGNGIMDGPELSLANVRVYSDTNGGNTYTNGEPTVLTDASGNYTLSGLKVGSYKIRVVLATGQVLSTDIPDPIAVASRTTAANVNFGVFLQATISGTVFNDLNANKARDTGEVLLGAKTVFIDTNGNGKKDVSEKSAVTVASGSYTLTGLGPGPWTLLVVLPTGQTQTTDNLDPISLKSSQTVIADFGMRDAKLGPPVAPIPADPNAPAAPTTPVDAISVNTGYWLASAEGGVFAYGNAPFFGSAVPFKPVKPIVGLAPTPQNKGYYLVATDGGIFSFGDAKFFGSMGGLPLNKPMVGMASTPSGLGYWTVASDGGIFAYGDAKFFGSTGSMTLNKPIVGMQATSTGNGYWLVASDGGIFAYGDAKFFGSTGSIKLNKPIVGMARGPGDNGYWLVASDGGIFAYGSANFMGSGGDKVLSAPIVNMRATYVGDGYLMVGSDGAVYVYGKTTKFGEKPLSQSPFVD